MRMSRPLFGAIVVALSTASAIAQDAATSAQSAPHSTNAPYGLVISTDKSTYERGETVSISLSNTGTRPLLFYMYPLVRLDGPNGSHEGWSPPQDTNWRTGFDYLLPPGQRVTWQWDQRASLSGSSGRARRIVEAGACTLDVRYAPYVPGATWNAHTPANAVHPRHSFKAGVVPTVRASFNRGGLAESYFPLTIGNQWAYASDGKLVEVGLQENRASLALLGTTEMVDRVYNAPNFLGLDRNSKAMAVVNVRDTVYATGWTSENFYVVAPLFRLGEAVGSRYATPLGFALFGEERAKVEVVVAEKHPSLALDANGPPFKDVTRFVITKSGPRGAAELDVLVARDVGIIQWTRTGAGGRKTFTIRSATLEGRTLSFGRPPRSGAKRENSPSPTLNGRTASIRQSPRTANTSSPWAEEGRNQAKGAAAFAGAYLIKEGVKAAFGGNFAQSVQNMATPEFAASFAAFTGAATPSTFVINKIARAPHARGRILRQAVPLAVGMTAVEAVSGQVSPQGVARSTAAYLTAGLFIDQLDRTILKALNIPAPAARAAGLAYMTLKTAAVLGIGEQIDNGLSTFVP